MQKDPNGNRNRLRGIPPQHLGEPRVLKDDDCFHQVLEALSTFQFLGWRVEHAFETFGFRISDRCGTKILSCFYKTES